VDNRKPDPRASLASLALPANQIAVFLGSVPVKALADTGTAISVVDKRIFDNIRKANSAIKPTEKRCRELYTADKRPIAVIADCETELKLNNLKIPVTLAVVQDLGYDLIIGMDVLRQSAGCT
jgi:hypothetical protein